MTTDDHGQPADRWLTLTEAAARSGYSREAIRQRVRRGKLRAIKGNDGVQRIAARDLKDLPPPDDRADVPGRPEDEMEDTTLAVLLLTVDDLRTDLGRTRTALDKALADREDDRVQALAGEQAATVRIEQVERERDAARIEREEARVSAARAEGEAKALREALDEARRPAWRRWFGVA